MPKREAGPMSGFRDMLAEQAIPRQGMIRTIQNVYEGYGFVPLDTPALERAETLKGKYGEEGEKLIYKFVDNGNREVAMRYDLTVPLARVVGQHQSELPMPYRRYQVGNVWRAESPQQGRFREFMQFDADIVGTKSRLADAEVVAMMTDTMDRLGARAQVRVNDRLLLDGLTHKAGIEDKDRGLELIGAIDKTEKIGPEAVIDEIAQKFDDKAAVLAKRYLGVQGTNAERIKQLQSLLKGAPTVEEGVDSLHDIFRQVSAAGYSEDQITFDQTIARGLNYYTGTIYETSLLDLPKIGSVCSGGRYDNLVKALGGPDLPAVGTSVGVDRLFTGLQAIGKVDLAKTHTKVLITNFSQGDNGSYLAIASSLRHSGIPTEVYYDSDKLGKQLRSASKKGIQFALMAGEDELASNMVTVKDLSTGQQENISQSELVNLINSHSTPQNG